MGIPLKEMKNKTNLGLLERSHGLWTKISLRGRSGNGGSSNVGESTHENTNGGTLGGAGSDDDNNFNKNHLANHTLLMLLEEE